MNRNGSSPDAHHGDHELHLRDLMNLVLRNVWLILIVAGAVIGTTIWYNWTTAPVFEARATIHVDQDRSAVMPELDFLNTVLRGGDVETEMALLRARHIAEATVDLLALQVRLVKPQGIARDSVFQETSATSITESKFYTLSLRDGVYDIEDAAGQTVARVAPGEATVFNGVRLVIATDPPGGLHEVIELRVLDRYEAVQELSDRLSVGRPFRDADLIAVSYQGTDPALVRQIPNAIAGTFIAQRIAAKKTEAVSMVEFLNDQIVTYSEQLTNAENAVEAFERGQQVVNLEAESAQNVARLVTMQAQRDDYYADLQTLTGILSVIDSVESSGGSLTGPSPFQRLASFPTFLENQAVTELLTDLNRTTNGLSAMRMERERTHPDVIGLERQIEQNEDQLYQLANSYRENLQTSIESLDQRLTAFGAELRRIPQKEVQQQRLQRRKATIEAVFNQLQSRLKEAEIAQAVEPGDVRVSDLAIYPRDPIRPRKMRSLVLSILFGLTLGLGVAGARDYMDETVHTREDLARATGLPVLALIPRIRRANGNGTRASAKNRPVSDRLVTRFDSSSPASEAYRTFRTNITFLNLEEPTQVLVFTSPGPAEGKSTSAANLAITLAQQGTPTLLVDCDLRRGIVHRLFGTNKEPGVTNILMGDCTTKDALHVVPLEDDAKLDFLATGTLPPNPSELLGSKKMRDLLSALRKEYEVIVIDSPPLNVVTDAAVLGTIADGVILIARAGSTARASLRYAKEQLETVRAPVSGIVLNDVNLSGRDRYYGSGAGYRYYQRYYKTDE